VFASHVHFVPVAHVTSCNNIGGARRKIGNNATSTSDISSLSSKSPLEDCCVAGDYLCLFCLIFAVATIPSADNHLTYYELRKC